VKKCDLAAGQTSFTWQGKDTNGKKVASGTYFYALQLDDDVLIRKMLLMK
jgi:flagellar hook assembly protein FlgD